MTTEMGLMLVVGIILFGVLEITIQKGSCCTQSRLNLQWPAAVCQLSYNLSLGIQLDFDYCAKWDQEKNRGFSTPCTRKPHF